MITSLYLVDFKNFERETLRVGPFTVIIGANASGKSNIRDAFRFLHGVGRGYSLADIIGGKYGSGGQLEWTSMRGAPNEISRLQQVEGYYGFLFSVRLKYKKLNFKYAIGVQSDISKFDGFRVFQESLMLGNKYIFTSHPKDSDPVAKQNDETHLLLRMEKIGKTGKYGKRIAVRPNHPALTQLSEHNGVRRTHKLCAELVIAILKNMRFLDLVPDRLRQPAFPGQTVLGDSGDNLPTVLREICSDPNQKKILVDWTRELTPMDVVNFEFPVDEVTGLVQLVTCEAGERKFSAFSISDGTLRFLAMLAALLSKDPARLYFFEEIDNGIHPARLHLLVDLIERRTTKEEIQVVTTTHSPDLLSIVGDKTFENTSVVCRLDGTSDAIIRPVSELPNARKLRETQGLGRLLSGGWIEDVLAFTSESKDEEGGK